MIEFKHGVELTKAIRSVTAVPADVAVAFWGPNAVSQLGMPDDLKGYRIACDAQSGACSSKPLRQMIQRGAQVFDIPGLHAKVYRSQLAMVVASANASVNGLSEDVLDETGLEAGAYTDDFNAIEASGRWFNHLVKGVQQLRTKDLKKVETAWTRARNQRPLRATLMDAIEARSPALADRRMRVYLYSPEEPSTSQKATYKSSKYDDGNNLDEAHTYPFFWGEFKDDVQVGDELLCFSVDKKATFCEGVWQILDKLKSGDDAVWPSVLVDRPLGRKLGKASKVCKMVNRATKIDKLMLNDGVVAIDVFANTL